jgi:hypothetical protein
MKKGLIALCAIAALSGTAAAQAHTVRIPTDIQLVGQVEGPAGNLGVYGFLATTKKCRAGRKVKLVFHYVTGNRVVDVDRTSRSGNLGLSGNPTGADGARVVAVKRRFGPRGHRHVCKGDSAPLLKM